MFGGFVMCFGLLVFLLPGVIISLEDGEFDMDKYFRMPPLYKMDDYDRCFEENPPDHKIVYCYARSQIRPNDSLEIWHTIKNFSNDRKRHFRHDRLVRGVCLHWWKPNFRNYVPSAKRRYYAKQFDNHSEITYNAYAIERGMADRIKYDKWTNLCVNWELKHKYDLKAYSQVEYCITDEENKARYETDTVDWTFVGIVCVLFALICASTTYDFYLKRRHITKPDVVCDYRNKMHGKYAGLAVSFSLPRNWYILMSESRSDMARDLRPIHALRFQTMFCVILGHTVLYMNSMPTHNPQYMEKNYYRIVTQLLINGPTVIQTYFVITGYLLSTQFMQLRANTSFKMRYLFQVIVYRYVRLTPVYMLLILFDATWLVRMQDGPVWLHVAGPGREFCRQNWWTNVLYVNNEVNTSEPCFQHGWYLAADFQLFVLGVVLHMIFWRFPRSTKLLLTTGVILSYVIPGLVTYVNHFEGIFMATPESQRYLQWYDIMYRKVYIPSYMNAGSFLCGTIGGIVYATAKRERWPLGNSKVLRALWWSSVPVCVAMLLAGHVFYAYDMDKPSVWMAAYAASQRNVWGMFMAAIITAMAFGIGWIAKDMLCHPVFRPLGRLTFCAYLVHPTVIRFMLGSMREPVYWSDNSVIMNTLGALVISYGVAFFLSICLEYPITAILHHFNDLLNNERNVAQTDGGRLHGNMLELNNRK